MTERLYYTDAYLTAFTATVLDRAEGGRRIYLDRTAFYPTSGGQPYDTGTIAGAPVDDVVDEGDRIAHLLAAPVEADRVEAQVNWERRFDHMQQHTGQHLLSAIFADRFGWQTTSVHFGAESSTLDLETESVAPDEARAVLTQANSVVLENRPVEVSFEDAASVQGLRKPPTREGTLRIISIAGVDRSACGGTHVRTTGEIGPILIRRLERVRKRARVEFVCGFRALRRAQADYDALASIAQVVSAPLDEAPALVAAQAEQLRQASSTRKRLEAELSEYRARELYQAAADGNGVRRAVVRRDSGSLEELRPVALAFAGFPHAVFIGMVTDPPQVLVAASDDAGVNAGDALRTALSAVGGRGGGSPRIAQGTVPERNALGRVVDLLSGGAG